jgi:hypothetical protein
MVNVSGATNDQTLLQADGIIAPPQCSLSNWTKSDHQQSDCAWPTAATALKLINTRAI